MENFNSVIRSRVGKMPSRLGLVSCLIIFTISLLIVWILFFVYLDEMYIQDINIKLDFEQEVHTYHLPKNVINGLKLNDTARLRILTENIEVPENIIAIDKENNTIRCTRLLSGVKSFLSKDSLSSKNNWQLVIFYRGFNLYKKVLRKK